MFKINDLVIFEQHNVKLIGVIFSLDCLSDDNSYEIITLENFQYPQLITGKDIIKKIGHNDSFKFINDETNHIFKVNEFISFKVSKKFLKEYWEYSNHDYGKSFRKFYEELFLKFNIQENEVITGKIISYEGPYLVTIHFKDNNLIIPEKLLAKFQVEGN